MKKLNIKVLSLFVAAAGMFAGCSQEELVKSDIDNANYADVEVTFSEANASNISVTSAVLNVDLQGAAPEIIEVGFMYSPNEDMSSAKTVIVTDSIADGTLSVAIDKLTPAQEGTKYYAYAYAYVRGNAIVSETFSFVTAPAIPISKESLNQSVYAANGVADAWGTVYDFAVTVLTSEENDTAYICNLDPYFAVNGLTAENGFNYIAGVLAISEDGSSATITCEAGQPMNYSDCAFYGFDAEGNLVTAPIVFNISVYGTVASIDNGYAVYASDGYWSAFPTTLTFEKAN